jgi:uncharacterized LabA/DUF88 family protein
VRDWVKFLLELDIKKVTPDEANQIVIDYYRMICGSGGNSAYAFTIPEDKVKDVDYVLHQLQEKSDSLVPEDD